MLDFDFCYIGPSDNEDKYVLIIKDDVSSYVLLVATNNADQVTIAEIPLKSFSSFGTVENWISDRGTHFLDETIEEIRNITKASHHFTQPYCPWSNGTVEVVCRELQKETKSIISELRLPTKIWPTTLSMVQRALKNTCLKRLKHKCPMEIFTGHPQDSSITAFAAKLIKRQS